MSSEVDAAVMRLLLVRAEGALIDKELEMTPTLFR